MNQVLTETTEEDDNVYVCMMDDQLASRRSLRCSASIRPGAPSRLSPYEAVHVLMIMVAAVRTDPHISPWILMKLTAHQQFRTENRENATMNDEFVLSCMSEKLSGIRNVGCSSSVPDRMYG